MKNFTVYPLAHYNIKIISIAGVIISLCLILISNFFFIPKLYDYSLIAMGYSLALIIMSKEKIDDEKIIQIRYTAYRVFTGTTLLMFLFWSLKIAKGDKGIDELIIYFVLFCELVYLLTFYILLLTDSNVARNDDVDYISIKKNWKFSLILFLFTMIAFVVMIFLRNL